MPKISELPALAKATSEDLIPIVDDAGNITKKVRAADAVPDKAVKAPAIDFDTFTNTSDLLIQAFVVNVNVTANTSTKNTYTFPKPFKAGTTPVVTFAPQTTNAGHYRASYGIGVSNNAGGDIYVYFSTTFTGIPIALIAMGERP